ncbi:hypothetical protein ACFV2X_47570 [Streptomyces sp. NPDC059679]|uniref:hypothetical protein n=1 Tax=Streptomyces sp. NPDC059679 TaxID=3346903 RepID=UPI0036CFABEF
MVSMPVLRERGHRLLVMLGAIAWFFVGGHVVENDVGAAGTMVFLALFTAFGTLLTGVEPPSR